MPREGGRDRKRNVMILVFAISLKMVVDFSGFVYLMVDLSSEASG